MGPCTANARRPTVESRCRGATISCCVADLSRCLPTTSVTGVQQSTRYRGALPCQHLHVCMMTPSLYVTRSATSSQCRSSCKILVRPWSNFHMTHGNTTTAYMFPEFSHFLRLLSHFITFPGFFEVGSHPFNMFINLLGPLWYEHEYQQCSTKGRRHSCPKCLVFLYLLIANDTVTPNRSINAPTVLLSIKK